MSLPGLKHGSTPVGGATSEMRLSRHLKSVREDVLKLSQSAFASLLQVSQSNVSRWEKDLLRPETEHLVKLANLLQGRPEALYFFEAAGVPTTRTQRKPRRPAVVTNKNAGLKSADDATLIRRVIVRSLKRCKKSRAAVAQEMTTFAGRKVTERMLNCYAADCREDVRFPAELERAFCLATGSSDLMTCRIVRAGLFVITKEEKLLLDLGRSYADLKRRELRLIGGSL